MHHRHISPGLGPTALCGRSLRPEGPDDGHRGYDYCSVPDVFFDDEWCLNCVRELEKEAREMQVRRVGEPKGKTPCVQIPATITLNHIARGDVEGKERELSALARRLGGTYDEALGGLVVFLDPNHTLTTLEAPPAPAAVGLPLIPRPPVSLPPPDCQAPSPSANSYDAVDMVLQNMGFTVGYFYNDNGNYDIFAGKFYLGNMMTSARREYDKRARSTSWMTREVTSREVSTVIQGNAPVVYGAPPLVPAAPTDSDPAPVVML